ncbi:DUF3768 domain-containing protein [Hyphomonas atlantica corrig.]|uniref:DUF3768 domain-containing protein n=1 Tax=Hyphomonas atlantica TaxID=1280948 RepID=UPI00235395B3|nr:DUF3768 domain-containing protein [Hyphomonas atlantica]
MTNPNTNKIADQNDAFRKNIAPFLTTRSHSDSPDGMVVMTPRVSALGLAEQFALLLVVRNYSSFDPDNDPHGERDFGAIDLHGTKWFWKIDYYADASCEWGSEDPSDPAKCYRALTVMHASEY